MTDLSPGLPAAALATDLLRRLRPLLAHPQDTPTGLCDRGLGVFGYCAREREPIARVQSLHPVVGILVQGAKEVWFGDLGRKRAAGYASRSHFASGFRAAQGALPRQTRKASR